MSQLSLPFQSQQTCAVKQKTVTSDGTDFILKDLVMSVAAYIKNVFLKKFEDQ